jgi:hypothetical protein
MSKYATELDLLRDKCAWQKGRLGTLLSLSAHWAQSLNRRAEVEQWLFDASTGKRALPNAEECRALAMKLGVPNELRDARFDAALDPARLAEFDQAIGQQPQSHPIT